MKKYLFTTVIILAFMGNVQSAVKFKHAMFFIASQQDTNKYLRDNIIAHKEKFQHKTLNELCKELGLQVKSYLPIKVGQSDRLSDRGVILFFEDTNTKDKKLQAGINIPSLSITFEHTIPTGKTLGLYSKTFGAWGAAEQGFYGNMTIKDIQKNIEK